MNSKQAKKIKVEDLLLRLGHKPNKRSGNDLWYHSPLRSQDKTPSFKVNLNLNTWYDFGIGEGGNIIDLACQIFEVDMKGSLAKLESLYSMQTPLFSAHKEFSPKQTTIQIEEYTIKKEPLLKLVRETDITEPNLKRYVKSRGINFALANRYLRQIYFKYNNQDKTQYAVSLKNDAGSYEFRNSFMKGFLGDEKTITTFNVREGSNVAVFEGMFDFLSYLADHNFTELKSTVLIINSTALKEKAKQFLLSQNFKKAYFFLDNDSSGKAVFKFLTDGLPYQSVDKSGIYADFNDYNEYLKFKLALAGENKKS